MNATTDTNLQPSVHTIYERSTGSWIYLVADTASKHAVVIDPVLDSAKGGIETSAADETVATAKRNGFVVDRILETQGPASQRSAAWYLRTQLLQDRGVAPRVSMGKSFAGIQRMFARKYGMQDVALGSNIDADFQDGQDLDLGSIRVHVLRLPGQSPDHVGFMIGSNVFIGDSALTTTHDHKRTDFESEQAHQMWTSIQRLLGLPRETRIYSSQGSRMLGSGKAFVTVEELRSTYQSLTSC